MRRVVFTAFLLTVAMGGGWLLGQQLQPAPPSAAPPNLITGSDIGFRMEGSSRGRYYGTLMVRMKNGEWVEVTARGQGGVVPLDSRR